MDVNTFFLLFGGIKAYAMFLADCFMGQKKVSDFILQENFFYMAKFSLAICCLLVVKDELIEGSKNNFICKTIDEGILNCVDKVATKTKDGFEIDGFTFKNPEEIVGLIRNKLAHGEFIIDLENKKVSFKLENSMMSLGMTNVINMISKSMDIYHLNSSNTEYKNDIVVIDKNDKKVGYISIDVFSSTTYKQFKKEYNSLVNKKIDSLIIDVRNNPGGQLDDVKEILQLLEKRDKVLYQIQTKNIKNKVYDGTKSYCNYKISILINKGSASASEILATSLKENNKAILVGKTTYGKGTVQKAYSLSSGATLKYTTQKWLTPKGNWINEKGITPDEEVDLSDEYKENPSDDTDNQLQKAIEVLTK